MSKTIKALAERFYEIVSAHPAVEGRPAYGKTGDLSEVLSDDFYYGIMPGFAFGGDQVGLKAAEAWFANAGTLFEYWEVHPKRFIEIDESNLVVEAVYHARSNGAKNGFQLETVHLWTAKDGKMNTYKHYCDTAIVCAALGHNPPDQSFSKDGIAS